MGNQEYTKLKVEVLVYYEMESFTKIILIPGDCLGSTSCIPY